MSGEPWGAFPKLVGQDVLVAQHPAVTGAGQTIVVIDTGVDWHHPLLGNGMGPGYKIIAGYDFVDNDADPMDTDGHGTGVAGIIAASPFVYNGATYQGIAPGASIIALRVDDGTFSWTKEAPYVEKALQWVIAHRQEYNIVAINMSLGKGHYTTETSVTIISDELTTLGQAGVFMSSSSGNDGVTDPLGIEYPGADPNVYSVGSINSSDIISTFTERGPNMDLLAPGQQVPTLYYLPATQQHITLLADGTSFATPFVAGAAALLKQVDPTLTSQEIMAILKNTGTPNYDGDKEAAPYTGLTWPRVNIDDAVNAAFAQADDGNEDNDVLASATSLSFNNNIAQATNQSLVIGDADFFKFTLADHADVALALTTSAGASYTPSWALFDGNGTLLRNLSASDSIRLPGGTYYVRVNAPAATLDGTYNIAITRTPDDTLNNHSTATATAISLVNDSGAVSGSVLLSNLDDYYKFQLDAAYDVDLAVIYAGNPAPVAQLLDSSGNAIDSFASGALSRRLSAGTYYVKLHSDTNLAGTYGVTIDRTLVVTPGQNSTCNAIIYDAAGNLHMAYYDNTTSNLKYARRDTQGSWTNPMVVDGGLMAGQFVSIALDSKGFIGVAYYDANNADLKFAHYNNVAWTAETADATYTTGYYPSLKFDASDRAVITYYSKTSADLKLALRSPTMTPATWTLSTIDSAGDVGRYSSLALNPTTGRWAVGYENTGLGTFKYAEQTSKGWGVVTVDAATRGGGGYISLAFSSAGKASMSYYDAYNADLKLASFSGVKWSTTAVASKNSVGLYTQLQLDDAGRADILYYSRSADGVFRAKHNGTAWEYSSLNTLGGRWISRALDAQGSQTVVYMNGAMDLTVLDL